jgi:hypothetical protein
VTIRHADQGWNHYADRYEVVGPQGEVVIRGRTSVHGGNHSHLDSRAGRFGAQAQAAHFGCEMVRVGTFNIAQDRRAVRFLCEERKKGTLCRFADSSSDPGNTI